MEGNMLVIKGLNKTYKTKNLIVHALKDIDLEIGSKGFIVLLGKSGSGKSTLLNILGGLDSFDDGEIVISDHSTMNFKPKEWDAYRNTYVGFVFQEFYLIEEFTVGKNIALALELQAYPKEQITSRVVEILKEVDLESYKDRKPNETSGGQKQRIAIARALVKDPQIILTDEPTGNLDSETGRLILDTLKKLSEEKLVIMVTHDADFAKEYGDRIIELKDGEIISDYLNETSPHSKEELVDTDKKVIKLPKGQRLSSNVINYLNNILLNENEKIYLTLSELPVNEQIAIENKSEFEVDLTKFNNPKQKPFSLKKSSLPSRYALKLALHSLFRKKILLLLMSILFIVSLTFVGFSANLSFYDVGKATSLTFEKLNVNTIPLEKYRKVCYQDDDCHTTQASFTIEDFNSLKEEYKSINFTHSYKMQYPRSINISEFLEIELSNDYYNLVQKITIMDDNKDVFTLRSGRYPQLNEINITDYMGELFLKKDAFPELTTLDELVGQDITYNDINIKIVGIIDTDYEKYDHLKGKHSWRFMEEIINTYGQIFITQDTYEKSFYVSKENLGLIYKTGGVENYIQKESTIVTSKFTENLIGRIPIANDEMVVTLSTLVDYFKLPINIDQNEDIQSYLNQDFTLAQRLYTDNMVKLEETEFKVVGILNDYENTEIPFGLMFTRDQFNRLYHVESKQLIEITAFLGSNDHENTRFITDLDALNIIHNTLYSSDLYSLERTTNDMRNVNYIIGAIFASFASLLIFTIVSSSIHQKQKEIGTLRAIGARGFDVAKIFIFEGLMIAFVSSLFASIITIVLTNLLNNSFTKSFKLDIVLLYVNPISVFIIVLLSLLIVFISTFLPIRRIIKMNPIQAIKTGN